MLIIKAVKIGIKINEIPFEKIIQCESKIYGVKQNCVVISEHSICNNKNIVDISNSSCIPNLLRSKVPTCTIIDNRNIPTVEEISDGILFLNQFNDSITINNEPMRLEGTYVIKHSNSTVIAKEKTFKTNEINKHQPLPAMLQPRSSVQEFKEVLSLGMIKELQMNGTEQIDLLERKNSLNIGINLFLIVILVIVTTTVLYRKCKKETYNSNQMDQPKNKTGSITIAIENPPNKKETYDAKQMDQHKSKTGSITIGIDDLPNLIRPVTSNEDVRV